MPLPFYITPSLHNEFCLSPIHNILSIPCSPYLFCSRKLVLVKYHRLQICSYLPTLPLLPSLPQLPKPPNNSSHKRSVKTAPIPIFHESRAVPLPLNDCACIGAIGERELALSVLHGVFRPGSYVEEGCVIGQSTESISHPSHPRTIVSFTTILGEDPSP
jgi:hypothetical protein